MTTNVLQTTLKFVLGLFLLMPIGIVIADDDDDNHDRRAICPCFTSEMIDAGLVSLPGTVQDDGETRGDQDPRFPIEPVVACSPPEGTGLDRLEIDMEVFATTPFSNGEDGPGLAVGVGFLGVAGNRGAGSCSIEVTRVVPGDTDTFFLLVGAEPDQPGFPDAEGISIREMRACKREVLRSFTWRHFCANNEGQDN